MPSQYSTSLGLFHQNISGALGKQEQLYIAVDQLHKNGTHIDVICLTETNMLHGSEYNLKLRNFKLAATFSRKLSKRGGVAILVRDDVNYTVISEAEEISHELFFECCAINLIQYGIAIVCIYTNKTPSSTNCPFFNKLNDLLNAVCKNARKKYVICGDFNIDLLRTSSIAKELKQVLELYNCDK